MLNRMHLNLARYALAWKVEQLDLRIDKLVPLVEKKPELNPILSQLLLVYRQYVKQLQATL